MPGNQRKVLCVFGRILGGKTFSNLLDEFFDHKTNIECTHIDFFESDYTIKIGNPLSRISSGAEVAAKMAVKLRQSNINPADYDLLFFQSHRLCVPFAKYIETIPTIVALDATPRSAHLGNMLAYAWPAKLKALASRIYDSLWYGPIFKNVDYFLARTALVANSLTQDYGVAQEQIAVTYSPLTLSNIKHSSSISPREKPHLLFIGNDFDRKGGPFLLEVFEKYLLPCCSLTIVSKDPALLQRKWPQNVRFIPGIAHEQIHNVYLDSDIFVMPTWKDEMGIVICEAMAAGLPIVARNAGAQSELIDHGQNGFLMSYDSDVESWAFEIRKLVESSFLREKFGIASQEKAKALFDKKIFFSKIDRAIEYALQR